MGRLQALLRLAFAPSRSWRDAPELRGMAPARAARVWWSARERLHSDRRALVGHLLVASAVTGVLHGPDWQGPWAWLTVLGLAALLGTFLEWDIQRRTRRLVRRRLELARQRARRLEQRIAGPTAAGRGHATTAALLLGLCLLTGCEGERAVGGGLLDGLGGLDGGRSQTAQVISSPTLHRLLDEHRFAEVRRLAADEAATPGLSASARALFDALSHVGDGDCQAAVDLTEAGDSPLSARDQELLLSRSVELIASWHDRLFGVAPDEGPGTPLFEARWDAAHCLLDHARRLYPWREPDILACQEQVERLHAQVVERHSMRKLGCADVLDELRVISCPPEVFR